MSAKREDYVTIKENYEQLVKAWKTKQPDLLDNIVSPETKCNLSTVKKYPCGSQHGICGLKDFITKQPVSDFFYITICNYVSRLKDGEAHQSAVLVGKVGRYYENEVKVTEFSALNTNHWTKEEDSWKISEFKLDIQECSGDFDEFSEHWYFEHTDLNYYHGIHLPVISGELDNPWSKIPVEDQVKTDEEQILETFARYAFGIDTLNFSLLEEALSDDIIVNMAPWNSMDKRLFMATLKFKRMASFYWDHPAISKSILINDTTALLKLYRMNGHKQSTLPICYTKENVENCFADARYDIKLLKENGKWRITNMFYYLGTIDLGPYKADK